MLEFEILARGCYRPEQTIIDYHPELSMPMTPEIQAWMEKDWQQKLSLAQQQGTLLYDAPLIRFVSASSPTADTLRLTLGNTSYKEYVTTRAPAFASHHTREELSNAFSVCSVVETSDDFILLDQRAGVDTYVGRYHVIGGFLERSADMTVCQQPDPFAAMRREIQEETGIRPTDITEQLCLGVVYDLSLPHAELCFLTRLHIPLETVLHERTPEDQEIRKLQSLQVTADQLQAFIVRHHGNISPSGEPNMLLYGELRFGPSWLIEVLNYLG